MLYMRTSLGSGGASSPFAEHGTRNTIIARRSSICPVTAPWPERAPSEATVGAAVAEAGRVRERQELLVWLRRQIKKRRIGTARLMQQLDCDRSNTITLNEFTRGLASVDIDLERAEYMQLFKAVDADGNNSLTRKELEGLLFPGGDGKAMRRTQAKRRNKRAAAAAGALAGGARLPTPPRTPFESKYEQPPPPPTPASPTPALIPRSIPTLVSPPPRSPIGVLLEEALDKPREWSAPVSMKGSRSPERVAAVAMKKAATARVEVHHLESEVAALRASLENEMAASSGLRRRVMHASKSATKLRIQLHKKSKSDRKAKKRRQLKRFDELRRLQHEQYDLARQTREVRAREENAAAAMLSPNHQMYDVEQEKQGDVQSSPQRQRGRRRARPQSAGAARPGRILSVLTAENITSGRCATQIGF